MTLLEVFYDGACPLCRREISYFRKLPSLVPIAWVDLSDANIDLPASLDRCSALERMHVRVNGQQYYQGAAAFALLWSQFRNWRMLGWLLRLPPLTWCAELLYRLFLKIRPRVQRWVQKQEKL